MYHQLDEGLKFDEKAHWAKRIATETGMSAVTARDRIHVLAWPRSLKQRVQDFDDKEPTKDIYSYVLAIEVSIVEPSRDAFPMFYDHGRPPEKAANVVRGSLLNKTIQGIQTGAVRSREQIREITPLFQAEVPPSKRRTALAIFDHLVRREDFLYEDARTEIETSLPEILREKPPKPQKVVASIKSMTQTIEGYRAEYIQASVKTATGRTRLTAQLLTVLDELIDAATGLKERL
jgi:hypothetical protein